MSLYTLYVFKTMGYQGLYSKAIIPAVALGVGYKVIEYGLNAGR